MGQQRPTSEWRFERDASGELALKPIERIDRCDSKLTGFSGAPVFLTTGSGRPRSLYAGFPLQRAGDGRPGPSSPVGLTYASGDTTYQDASWVGLGWKLSPDVMVRQMRGGSDEFAGNTSRSATSCRYTKLRTLLSRGTT
jgi:hypothetical protein